MHLYDVRLDAGARAALPLVDGDTAAVLVLRGGVTIGGDNVGGRQLALLSPAGDRLAIEATPTSTVLVMSGEPIREPAARYGSFVMNTREELMQAVDDYRSGRMGHLD